MKKLLIIIVVIIASAISVRADTSVPNYNDFYYVFHLFQNSSGQLVIDRDFKFNYDIIPGVFNQPAVGQFPYHGDVVRLEGSVAAQFKFDVRAGKLSIQAPYVADGQKVVFYDNQNQPMLTISVSDSSFCNDDGICNADRGENSQNCPNDCKQTLLVPPTATPVATEAGSSGLWSGILYTILGILLAGLVWWFFKRPRNQGPLPPPSITLPTPPASPTPNNPV